MKYTIGFFFACVLLASCQQDISGTYKSIKPSDQFEKKLIIIDWEGDRYFERGHMGPHVILTAISISVLQQISFFGESA